MDDALLSLLDYQDVLGAVATTQDGLVLGAAGLSMEDSEVVAAAGSLMASTLLDAGQRNGSVQVDGGALHIIVGDEVAIVALTEAVAARSAVAQPLMDVLGQVDAAIRVGVIDG